MATASVEATGSDERSRSRRRGDSIISLQLLRFIAAFAVTVFHAHMALVLSIPSHSPGLADYAWRVGASGVHVFFVISGFVMVYTTYRGQRPMAPQTFLKRRFQRIYPIYWVMAAIYLLAYVGLGTPHDLSYRESALSLLLYGWAASSIIGPGWTLAFEVFFYLCFAVSIFFGLRRGMVLLTAFFLGAVAAGVFAPDIARFLPIATNSLLLEFIAGCWLGFAYLKGWRCDPRLGGALILSSLALFTAGVWLGYDRMPSIVSWGIPSLMLVVGGLSMEPYLKGDVARRLAAFGDSSYFLYLAHILLLDLLIVAPLGLEDRSATAANMLAPVLAVVCLLVSHAGHRWIELPLLSAIRRGGGALAAMPLLRGQSSSITS